MTRNLSARLEAIALAQHEEWITSTRGCDLPKARVEGGSEAHIREMREAKRAAREAARKAAYNARQSELRAESRESKRTRVEAMLDKGWLRSAVARELAMRPEELTKLLRGP